MTDETKVELQRIIELVRNHADEWAEKGSQDGVSACHGIKSDLLEMRGENHQ